MYTFKVKDAEVAIREYQRKHPNSKTATKALNGDCAAMMELYERLCGPIEQVVEDGPSDDAAFIVLEAINRKYVPAMVRFARDTMCLGDEYWADGLMMLIEAYKLGSQEAMTQIQNDWYNGVKDIEVRHKRGAILNKYEEFVLAVYYYNGFEAKKDETLANKLLLSSAKRGCDEAKKIIREIHPGMVETEDEHMPNDDIKVIVRIGCVYSYDMAFNDYREGERIRIDPNAISANFMILEDEDQDEAFDGREGELSKSFVYELHNGQLCAIVDGEFVPCEDEYQFECFLRGRGGEFT